MIHLVDMHMHAGFADDPAAFAHALAGAGIASFANTVTPDEYERLSPMLGSLETVRLGLGLHPWWIGTPGLGALDDALDVFETQLATTRFVGELTVKRSGDWLTLNFPAWSTEVVENPPALLFSALGIPDVKEVRVGRDYLVVLESQQQVEALTPDIGAMIPLDKMVCVTAPGEKYDFVSRFFCPGEGVPEDPVTGSAHSMLIPYWSEKLGKTSLYAHQGAHRGGDLRCEMKGDRVLIGGQATLYLKGKIFLR